MHWLDWTIVAAFLSASIWMGLWKSRLAGHSLESYFVSERKLGWWLAGTSMAATAFSSDTPLLITGMIRRKGIWGCWEVWALGIGTMLTVFVFAALWKRANVMTEVELVERRYSGRAGSFLRAFKALYWGLGYNCYLMGMWPIIGMMKVLQETTGLSRDWAIIGSVVVGAGYTACSGLWGVVLTDAFQFLWAMAGACVLAVTAVRAVGGLPALSERLHASGVLATIPPGPADPSQGFLTSPLGWWLGLVLIQWWAWKNADGGGVIVQRVVSCADERQAMRSVLWFNLAHYCLRSWPWVLTALASIILIPDAQLHSAFGEADVVDHERAYARLITMLLPIGWRGVLVASFFAAFLSTLSTQLNWGSSYLIHDVYRRFVNRTASEHHYLWAARVVTMALAAGAMGVAFCHWDIGRSFTAILNLTAGIGPVLLARWLWWRVNAWSEIAAMAVSLPLLWARASVLQWLGWPPAPVTELLFMVVGTALVWVPVTLSTSPVEEATLRRFAQSVRPPGWWRDFQSASQSLQASGQVAQWPSGPHTDVERSSAWGSRLIRWLIGSLALLATTIGPLEVLVGSARTGWWWCAVGAAGWIVLGIDPWSSPAPFARALTGRRRADRQPGEQNRALVQDEQGQGHEEQADGIRRGGDEGRHDDQREHGQGAMLPKPLRGHDPDLREHEDDHR